MAAFSLVLTYSTADDSWGTSLAAELRILGNDVWDAASEEGASRDEAEREIQRRGLVLFVVSSEATASAALNEQIQFALVVGARVYPVERGPTTLTGLLEVRQAIKVSNLDAAGAARLIEERLLYSLSKEVGSRQPDATERGVAAGFYFSLSGSGGIVSAGPVYRADQQGLGRAGESPSHFLRFHSRQASMLTVIWFSCFCAPFVVLLAGVMLQSNVAPVARFLARSQTWPALSPAVRFLLAFGGLCYLGIGILLPLRAIAAGRALARMGRTLGGPVIGPWVERRVAAKTRALYVANNVQRGRRVGGRNSWRRRTTSSHLRTSPLGPAVSVRQDEWSALARDKGLLFVSHTDADNAWCQELVGPLYQAGYGVWSEYTPTAASAVSLGRHQEALQHCAGMLLVLSPEAWRTPLVQEDIQLAFALRRPIVSLFRLPTDVSGFVLTNPWLDVAFMTGADASHMLLDQLPGLLAATSVAPPLSGTAQRERAAAMYSMYSPLGPWHALKSEQASSFVCFHAAQACVVKIYRLAQVSWTLVLGLMLAPLVVPMVGETLFAAVGPTVGGVFIRVDIALAVIFGCLFIFAVIPWWCLTNFQLGGIQRRILVVKGLEDSLSSFRDDHSRMWLAAPVAHAILRAHFRDARWTDGSQRGRRA